MQPHPYGNRGLSRSLYNSSYMPKSSYYSDDNFYPSTAKSYVKDPAYMGRSYLQDRGYYDDYYAANKPAGKVWSDYIPIEKSYFDYVPQQKIEYIPVEKNYTDYLEIEHQTDYIPVPKLHKHIEYIPVERYDESVDYYPYEKSYVKGMSGSEIGSTGYAPGPRQYQPGYQTYQRNYGGNYGGSYGGNYHRGNPQYGAGYSYGGGPRNYPNDGNWHNKY